MSETEGAVKSLKLGERMKTFESTSKVHPFQPFIVRADGNRFSKFTKGLHKPFDKTFERAMIKTANGLLDHFSSSTVFVCSDEISLVFPAVCTEEEFDIAEKSGESNVPVHIYSGRHNKIETLVSSKASVLFNNHMVVEVRATVSRDINYYSQDFVQKVEKREAIFDARLIPFEVGSEFEIVNNLIWRSCYDCHRNTLSSYARHRLGRAAIVNKNSQQMLEMMKNGHDFDFPNVVSMAERYGVFCKMVECVLTNTRGEEYTRYKHFNFTTNLMDADRKKSYDLFICKYFVEGLVPYEEYVLK